MDGAKWHVRTIAAGGSGFRIEVSMSAITAALAKKADPWRSECKHRNIMTVGTVKVCSDCGKVIMGG